MANTIAASMNVALSASATFAGAQNNIVDSLSSGTPPFSALTKSLGNGTGAGNAQLLWHQQRTVAAGVNDDIDLSAQLDSFGNAVNFAKVKWVLIRLTAPAAGVRVVIGNATSNPWQAWFGGTAHTEECRDILLKVNQLDGWTVSGGSKVLRINNPTAAGITYDILLLGE